MPTSPDRILRDALKFPAHERARLAAALFSSLGSDSRTRFAETLCEVTKNLDPELSAEYQSRTVDFEPLVLNSLAPILQWFSFNLFSAIRSRQPGNVFISPLGAAACLSVAYAGARGKTREAMAKVLGYGDTPQETLGRAWHSLLNSVLDEEPDVEFYVATSLWLRDGVQFHDSFVRHAERSYDAEIETLDVLAPGSGG